MSESNEQKLRDQYAEIAVLAGRLAHEIRNPLSTISLNVEMLVEDFSEASTPRERRALNRANIVQRECLRLQELLNDFLSFARAAHKSASLRLEPPGRRSAGVLRAQVEGGQDRNRAVIGSESAGRADRSRAIARRAVESGHQRPTSDARRRTAGSAHARHSERRGAGSDRHRRGHGRKDPGGVFSNVFFQQARRVRAGATDSRKIIEAHGGTISVQSAVGRGTQFTIELPGVDWPLTRG